MLFEKIKLEPGEELLQTVRKHWFVITMQLLAIGLVLLLPFIMLWLLYAFADDITIITLDLSAYGAAIWFGLGTWALLCLFALFSTWTHYYLDLWIITDRRIILVDQVSFFNRNVSIFRLERMQDIEYKITGLLATLLNFGTLKAQTAGAHESNFTSTGLPDPRGLQATIQAAMDTRMQVLHITPDEVAVH